jgi:hypothetical protein
MFHHSVPLAFSANLLRTHQHQQRAGEGNPAYQRAQYTDILTEELRPVQQKNDDVKSILG